MMNAVASSMIVLAAITVVVAPVLLALRRPRLGWPVAGSYVAAFLAMVTLGSDFSVSRPVLRPVTAGSGPENIPSDACAEALAASEQVGIIVDRPSRGRVRVNGSLWGQLPEQAQEALRSCIQSSGANGDSPVEIVVQN